MACTLRRFFGLHLAEESADTAHERWGTLPERAGALLILDHIELWRMVRRPRWRAFAAGMQVRVLPVGRVAATHVRFATACETSAVRELQVLVRVLAQAEQSNASIYLIHTDQETLRGMEQNVRATFPGLRIVGRAAFHHSRRESILAAVRKAAPSFLVVADGSRSVIEWVVSFSHSMLGCVTLVAPRSGVAMSGKRGAPRLSAILGFPARLALPPILLIHRLLLLRRGKALQA